MDTIIPQKTCNKCNNEFPATKEFFVTGKLHKDGLRPLCKECRKMTRKDRKNPPVPRGMKRCPQCKNILPATATFFSLRTRAKDGLYENCRECRKATYNARKDAFDQVERPESFTCRGCEHSFPFTEQFFYKNARNAHGLFTKCKTCLDKQNKQYILEHMEEYVERGRKWRHKNRAHIINVVAKWRKANIDHCREAQRRRYAENTEQIKRWKHRYNHSEKGSLRNRCYHRVRDARKRSIGGRYTAQDVQRQYARQKGKCYWCHQKITKYHIDHVIPITREGSSNDPWNIVISCPPCNIKRGNKLPHEWPEGGRLM